MVFFTPRKVDEEGLDWFGMVWILLKSLTCIVFMSMVDQIDIEYKIRATGHLELSAASTKNIIMFSSILISCQIMHDLAIGYLTTDILSTIIFTHLTTSILWAFSTIDNLPLFLSQSLLFSLSHLLMLHLQPSTTSTHPQHTQVSTDP